MPNSKRPLASTADAKTRMPWTEIRRLYVGKAYCGKTGGHQETRFVLDCNLGGDVIYRIRDGGRWRLLTSPQHEWLDWVSNAQETKP